jgi:hypothetical protein
MPTSAERTRRAVDAVLIRNDEGPAFSPEGAKTELTSSDGLHTA